MEVSPTTLIATPTASGTEIGKPWCWRVQNVPRSARVFWFASLAAALLIPGLALAGSAGEESGVSLCSPAMMADIRPTCFPPGAAASIEHREIGLVVTPRGLVWRITGLRLRQVSVERLRGQLQAIDYLFGRLPANPHVRASVGAAQYNARRPLYVLVRESRGRGLDSRPVLFEARGENGPGAWHFTANLPGREGEVLVITNEGRTATQHIGNALLRRSADP